LTVDLKQLEYFVRVAELGSFVKAAELLGIAQPTLSRRIRALEIELGRSFFHRNGRGVVLTPEGSRFVEQAQAVLLAADAAVQGLRTGSKRLTGHVTCGLTPSVGSLIVPLYVQRFRESLPDATLSIVNHLSNTLHDQLRANRLDFAIYHNVPLSSTLTVTPLSSEKLYLVGSNRIGSQKNTVDFAELDGLPIVMPSRLHAIRAPVEAEAARQGIRLNIVIEIDDMASVFQLTTDGVGHTISTRLPLLGLRGTPKLVVQQIINPQLFTHLALVTPPQAGLTPLQRAAADLARATYLDLILPSS
jgi:LysR family nitrogen assimilation transcriptional regulator